MPSAFLFPSWANVLQISITAAIFERLHLFIRELTRSAGTTPFTLPSEFGPQLSTQEFSSTVSSETVTPTYLCLLFR